MSTVAIVQRALTHYRVPLFDDLRSRLAADGIRLRLLHGSPTAADALRRDQGQLPWAEPLPTRHLAGGRICWLPWPAQVADCDLVVMPQENRLVNNLPWLLRPPRDVRVAFWGHGANLQSAQPDGPAEGLKRRLLPRVDWWFAYTKLSAERVEAAGYPSARITVLDNAIDTRALQADLQQARQTPRADLRRQLGLSVTEGPLGLFLGSLHADKDIPLLLQAAAELGRRVPGFQLLVAGDGPLAPLVQAAQRSGAPVWALGAVHGLRKAQALAAADLLLNPGMVGLGVLDAFVAGLVLVTRRGARHSPEVVYLQDGTNGSFSGDSLEDFVAACQRLLLDDAQRRKLALAAAGQGARYTIEGMSERFAQGIRSTLAAPTHVRRW